MGNVSMYSATIQSAFPAQTESTLDLVSKLQVSGSTVDRFNSLLLDEEKSILPAEKLRTRTVFDFNSASWTDTYAGSGSIITADLAKFPILTGLGVSVALGFLGPCGLNTPHTHPRASEFLVVTDGELQTGFVLDNGFVNADGDVVEVRTSLNRGQGSVFPVGSTHWQFNPSCDNTTFFSALSSEDPGASQTAQTYFALSENVVNATLGFPASIDGESVAEFRSRIPDNVAQIVESCTEKCGYGY
ncbi:MAG: hypothetical protein Q9198_004000 [Flavoplaca austrocitrina]